MKTHANLINGRWTTGSAGIENINPADTEDCIGRFAQASREEVNMAIGAARAASGAWAATGIQRRHDILQTISAEILKRRDELGRLLSREEGKTLAEGVGEVTRAGQIFGFFAGETLRQAGDKVESVRPGIEVDIVREPIGVIGIITPWNFPIAIPAWKIAPALAYGNCVVFKPAELVPGSAWALADIISRAGVPEGVFNLVMGPGRVVGAAMLESAGIDAITFTGSVATGRQVAMACAERMRKFQLEMGGKNPLVVLDDADLSVAVDCAINGAFFSTGQRCTASSRLIVTEGIHDRFVAQMIERLESLVIGDPLDSKTQIGPVVDQRQLDQDLDYIRIGQQEGAVLAWGGGVPRSERPGFFLQPALFTETNPGMRINREEIFGPVASVVLAKNYDEALHLANDTEFGLAAGICTTNLKFATHFRRNAQAGMVMVNLPTAGVDYHVPFGGHKSSSYGPREQGRYAAEFYTTVKTTYLNA